MITLNLDWHEVLWWMQGGMAGSHLRWSVYKEMVNRVWPQCSEQERRNIFLIMRRDLGAYWRPDGWNSHSYMEDEGEGPWKEDIMGKTPWMYFRQVLTRFNPEAQYAVTLPCPDRQTLDDVLRFTPAAVIISQPNLSHFRKDDDWHSDTATITVRTYLWQNEYRIDWSRRCEPDRIQKAEKLEIL